MAEWLAVCPLEELPDNGRGKAIEIENVRLAVFRADGEVFALSGRCPHANGPLGRGWIEEGEIVCPLHRWRFRLSDGRCSTVTGEDIFRFPCEVRDGTVWVKA